MNPRTLSDQEIRRREELAELRKRGINPYPYAWEVTDHAADILRTFSDTLHQPDAEGNPPAGGHLLRVSIAGRIMRRRIMGKASFFHLQDETGQIQVYVRRDDLPEGFYNEVFKKLMDIGDIVGVRGFVFRTKTGEISVHAQQLELLAKALRPIPVVKEKGEKVWNEIQDKEFRYRQRYVDLMVHPEVREVFRKRGRMIAAIRRFLEERGYLEVETPQLQPRYGGATARPFITHHNALDMDLYLRIAPELYLKRLLVGGFEGVFEIGKNFRNEGISRLHNPEFTMLELYVAYRDYHWMMDLTEELLEYVATVLYGKPEVPAGPEVISFRRPWKRLDFFGAIEQYTGYDLYGKDRAEVARVARALDLEIDETMGLGKLLDEIFSECVEPHLFQPTFIMDYPLALSPLAKRHREREGLVERFEVICRGMEICNAFSELNDPLDQRARFEEQARLRAAGDEEAMDIDTDYLRALEYGMPPAAGIGIGIDRLAMIMTDQSSIRDVILFPLLRPERPTSDGASET